MADPESITGDGKKRCSKCNAILDASMFSPDRRASTGLQSMCRPCANASRKLRHSLSPERYRATGRAYYAANKERVLAANARSRAKHADKVKAHKRARYLEARGDPEFKARRKAYALSQKDAKREYDKKYRSVRRDEHLARVRRWVLENRERRRSIVKAYDARRRAKEASGDSTAKIHAWEMAAPKVCYWCGTNCRDNYHVDHYLPLARGGLHEVKNLVIACPTCNLRKNAKDPYEFAASVGRLF